ALDGPLHAFLVKAWDARQDLKRFCKADEYPRDRTVAYDLKETLTTLTFTPGVQLRIKEAGIDLNVGKPIIFEIQAKVTSAPVLRIRGGRILSARFGKINGACSIKCADLPLYEGEGDPIEFHKEIPVGIAICGDA